MEVWPDRRGRSRLFIASTTKRFGDMTDFVFQPPIHLARVVAVRTLDDAAEFARTYAGPRLPYRRDRVVRRLEAISDEASARGAARAFRAWAIAEGLLAEEKGNAARERLPNNRKQFSHVCRQYERD